MLPSTKPPQNDTSAAADYWATRFTDPQAIAHHVRQNQQISQDFYLHSRNRWQFRRALSQSSIIEIGCGSGDFAQIIGRYYQPQNFVSTDFSAEAVIAASERLPHLNFRQHDILTDPIFGHFDLAVASNVLEHFKHPHAVIEKMLKFAPQALAIVPYGQPLGDGYEGEGGAGHVYTFRSSTFDHYFIHDRFLFETEGWQHSTAGERPRQLAVLFSKKP